LQAISLDFGWRLYVPLHNASYMWNGKNQEPILAPRDLTDLCILNKPDFVLLAQQNGQLEKWSSYTALSIEHPKDSVGIRKGDMSVLGAAIFVSVSVFSGVLDALMQRSQSPPR